MDIQTDEKKDRCLEISRRLMSSNDLRYDINNIQNNPKLTAGIKRR